MTLLALQNWESKFGFNISNGFSLRVWGVGSYDLFHENHHTAEPKHIESWIYRLTVRAISSFEESAKVFYALLKENKEKTELNYVSNYRDSVRKLNELIAKQKYEFSTWLKWMHNRQITFEEANCKFYRSLSRGCNRTGSTSNSFRFMSTLLMLDFVHQVGLCLFEIALCSEGL